MKHRIVSRALAPWLIVGTVVAAGAAAVPARLASASSARASTTFVDPSAVATDLHGNVYVSDWGTHSITKLTPSGSVAATWKSGLSLVARAPIAVGKSGNVWVLDSVLTSSGGLEHILVKLSGKGKVLARYSSLQIRDAIGLTLGAKGDIVIMLPAQSTAKNPATQLVTLNTAGKALHTWEVAHSGFDYTSPLAITSDVHGSVYVSVAAGTCPGGCQGYGAVLVEKYSVNGQLLKTWKLAPRGATSLAVAKNGAVYLGGLDNVARLSSKGKVQKTFGSIGCGATKFKGLAGLAFAANGTLYAADEYNHNVQKLKASGTSLAVWGGCPAVATPSSGPPPPPPTPAPK